MHLLINQSSTPALTSNYIRHILLLKSIHYAGMQCVRYTIWRGIGPMTAVNFVNGTRMYYTKDYIGESIYFLRANLSSSQPFVKFDTVRRCNCYGLPAQIFDRNSSAVVMRSSGSRRFHSSPTANAPFKAACKTPATICLAREVLISGEIAGWSAGGNHDVVNDASLS